VKVRIVVDRVSCEGVPLTGAQAIRLREAIGDALRQAVRERIANGGGRENLPTAMREPDARVALTLATADVATMGRGIGEALMGAVWSRPTTTQVVAPRALARGKR
jgi:hypothetical protein